MKNTNESAKVVPSSNCVETPTYNCNVLDGAQLQASPYLTALGPAVSYLPFTTGPTPATTGPPATRCGPGGHLLPAGTSPMMTDYNAVTAAAVVVAGGCGGAGGGGMDASCSYSNTSSFTVAASPCVPMFYSSETSFQLSTSPCPSDANLTVSQVTRPTVCTDVNVIHT